MAEAVFEEYDEQQEEMNAPEPVLEPVQGSVEPQGGLMAEYEKMLAERGLSTDHDFMSEGEISTDPLEVIQLEEEEGLDFLEYIEGFDAARAVVYSAIINRIDY